jgi:hypothetical protein
VVFSGAVQEGRMDAVLDADARCGQERSTGCDVQYGGAGAASGHVRELTISIREVVPAICGH